MPTIELSPELTDALRVYLDWEIERLQSTFDAGPMTLRVPEADEPPLHTNVTDGRLTVQMGDLYAIRRALVDH